MQLLVVLVVSTTAMVRLTRRTRLVPTVVVVVVVIVVVVVWFGHASADVTGHFRDEGESVDGRLVDSAHLVIYKGGGEEHREREDLGAVLPRLVEGVDALRVEEKKVVGTPVGRVLDDTVKG